MSQLILDGPKEELNLTKNTQPAIFLVSYSIFNLAIQEFKIELNKAKFFAGHSLGEYSALSAARYLNFSETIKLLRLRGEEMQNAVPPNMGGMIVTLGSKIDDIEKLLYEQCNHEWQYQPPQIYERASEYCKICNLVNKGR